MVLREHIFSYWCIPREKLCSCVQHVWLPFTWENLGGGGLTRCSPSHRLVCKMGGCLSLFARKAPRELENPFSTPSETLDPSDAPPSDAPSSNAPQREGQVVARAPSSMQLRLPETIGHDVSVNQVHVTNVDGAGNVLFGPNYGMHCSFDPRISWLTHLTGYITMTSNDTSSSSEPTQSPKYR
jgi:hypothetical protein